MSSIYMDSSFSSDSVCRAIVSESDSSSGSLTSFVDGLLSSSDSLL